MPAPGDLVTIAAVHCGAQNVMLGATLRVVGTGGIVSIHCLECGGELGEQPVTRLETPKGIDALWPDCYLGPALPGATLFDWLMEQRIRQRQEAARRKAERELKLLRREAARKAAETKTAKRTAVDAGAAVVNSERTRPGRALDCQTMPLDTCGEASCCGPHSIEADPSTLALIEAAIVREESAQPETVLIDDPGKWSALWRRRKKSEEETHAAA
jgi:hypothetical protein